MNKAISPSLPSAKKILLIKMGAVGDLIMASSFFEALRQNYPQARISHLVSDQLLHTVKENPHIDRFIPADSDALYKGGWFSRFREVFRLISLLRKERFDMVFVLHWAWQFNVLAFLCGIPVRVGFKRKWGRLFLTHRVRSYEYQSNREAYLNLIRILGVPVRYHKSHYHLSEQENRFLETFVEEYGIGAEEQLIAVAPGGGRNLKQIMLTRLWPVDRYMELIGNILQAGLYRIVLIAGPDDGPVIQPILEQYPQCIDTRTLSFGEKASILRRCRLLVGNDSAPIHMSTAMSIPTYSLWGPTHPKRYGDPVQHHTSFFKEIECSPCYSYGEFPECNDNQCMQAISVAEVWETLQAALSPKISKPAFIESSVPEKEFPEEIVSAPQGFPERPNPPTA
ncbi:MAG: glycosyltransferase family 9 protein [Nitrospinota bacterium]|nr:glycosyltransferase family 9 protein [Nitrospinota bacterium]